MRTYEACCIFRVEDDKYNAGKDQVREVLNKLGAQEMKEDDMQIRTLAFPIKKIFQGHYHLFTCNMDPDKAHQIEHDVRLIPELMRILVSVKDE